MLVCNRHRKCVVLYEDDQECSVCKEIETYVDTISNQEDIIYELEEDVEKVVLERDDLINKIMEKEEDLGDKIKELKKEIETISHDNEIAQHRIGILEEELADSL